MSRTDSDHRFRKTQRLLTRAEFDRVFKDASAHRNRCFTLLTAREQLSNTANDSDAPHARLGLVIAKKKVRHAVDRNRIKRILREAFRHLATELPAHDFIVLANPGTANRANTELMSAAHDVFSLALSRPAKTDNQAPGSL